MKKETQMAQFLRIASARLRKIYKFRPQRRAWAAKMYTRWIKRKQDLECDDDVNMYI